ncbi:MAG: proton-conducting transporter membrane subunit [Egibacteraceae bacterium]
MTTLLPLALVVPVAGAALCLLAHRHVRVQRALSVVAVVATFAVCLALLVAVDRDGTVVATIGGWPAPIGIVLVADLFSALLLAVAMATVLGVLVFALGQIEPDVEVRYFHPLYLVLAAGVSASFLTGDLFNLFVAFEVMLIASYVLLSLGAQRASVRPAMTYVVVNLLASTLFISAVALIYAATGSVNMADLAGKLADLPPGLQRSLSLLLLVVFGIKAAIFPLFFWLPDSYPTAPTAVTAVFAGLLTKVGVYAIIRTQTIMFGGLNDGPDTLVLVIAGATMVTGVLGAIAQDDVKRILSFHIVSQIGYMVLGLGLYSVAGLAGATLFIAHQIPVKTSLFLVGGMVEKMTGTGALHRLGGLARRTPLTGALFLLGAFSLAGFPPFSGFFGKLALIQAGLELDRYAIVGVALFTSILTVFSMVKIWNGTFWGTPDEEPPLASARGEGPLRAPRLMTAGAVSLVALTLAIAVGAEPMWDLSERAAQGLMDSSYAAAVLGEAGDLDAVAGGTP